MVSPMAALRMRMMQTVPAVRGRALTLQLDAQRRIAGPLAEAFPELDLVSAAALTGAFMGAVSGALQALLDEADQTDPAALQAAIQTATEVALAPWRVRAR